MKDWITTQEAANILGVSIRWIRELKEKGVIASRKEKRKLKVKITPEILERYGKRKLGLPEDGELNEVQKRYVRIRLQAVEMLKAGILAGEVAKRLGIGRRTVYEWLEKGLVEKYDKYGTEGLLNKQSSFKGKFRSLNVEQIKIVKGYWVDYPDASDAARYRRLASYFKALGIKPPHLKTVKKAWDEISHVKKELVKKGDFGFESTIVHRQRRAPAPFPNMQWEADEIVLDLLVKDDRGRELTPRMILIIDSCTRGIPGYAIDFTADNRLLDKAFYNAVLKEHNKPFCGIPDKLLTDHGKIFISKHTERTLADLGTKYIPVKVKNPWSKGVVERLARTLQEECLPFLEAYKGNRVSNRPPKEKIKPISMQTLKQEIDKAIAQYHNRKHSTLGMTPIERWQKAEADSWRAKVPREKELKLLLYYEVERTITKQGIRIFNHYYWSDKLYNLFKKKVKIKYNPDDLKKIMIYHKGEFYCLAEQEEPLSGEINIDIVKKRQKEAREFKRAEKVTIREMQKAKRDFEERANKFKEKTFQIIEPEVVTAFTKVSKDLKKIAKEEKEKDFELSREKPEKKRKIAIYPYQLEQREGGK